MLDLDVAGLPVTITAVHRELGGGSRRDVARVMRQLRHPTRSHESVSISSALTLVRPEIQAQIVAEFRRRTILGIACTVESIRTACHCRRGDVIAVLRELRGCQAPPPTPARRSADETCAPLIVIAESTRGSGTMPSDLACATALLDPSMAADPGLQTGNQGTLIDSEQSLQLIDVSNCEPTNTPAGVACRPDRTIRGKIKDGIEGATDTDTSTEGGAS